MTITTNKTGALCPICHRFGINHDEGTCEYCGYNKYKEITTVKADFEGREYWKVYLNGEYIGFDWSENDARKFGERYSGLLCL